MILALLLCESLGQSLGPASAEPLGLRAAPRGSPGALRAAARRGAPGGAAELEEATSHPGGRGGAGEGQPGITLGIHSQIIHVWYI